MTTTPVAASASTGAEAARFDPAVRVRVDSCLHLDRAEIPAKLLEWLRRALSLPNPAYLNRVRLGLATWGEPEVLTFVDLDEREVRLPRGAIHVLRRLAAVDGYEVRCDDHRVLPERQLPPMPEPSLRPYQAVAVGRLAAVTQGTVVMPCGGGKTRVGLGVIAHLRTPTLVLVHTLDLAEQWRKEILTHLKLAASVIGDGEHAATPVTIALVQALVPREPTEVEGLLSRFGLLIVDECHHLPATTFRALVSRSAARYRLGLTATPERSDGLTPLLEWYFGPPAAVVTYDDLVAEGLIEEPEIRTVETAFSFPYSGTEDYMPMLRALVRDGPRNALIVDEVVREARAGHTCLVLSGWVDHCQVLRDRLAAAGVAVEALTGDVPKARRTAILDGARRGDVSVLVATSLADEGLDLPRLSRVFLAFPGRARGRTLQRLGRLMRPHPDKADAVLFDFVDRRIPLLRRQAVERRHLYGEVLGPGRLNLRC